MTGSNANRDISPKPGWAFAEVVQHAWQTYVGGGIESGGRRNVLYRIWAAMVGAERATAELDHFIESHGGVEEAARVMGCAQSTIRRLRRQFRLVGAAPLSPVPLALAPGEELRGGREYVVADQLGAGGMGVVYRVMEKVSGDSFAAKVLSSHRFEITNAIRDRFLRESELARDFDSPCVVRSIESLHHRGTLVSVMELLPGETVYDAMRADELPGSRERLRWVCDITTGLAYLHQKKIVHRDLSPRNAMFRVNRKVAICDFGVARRTNDPTLTTSHEQMGSLLYISAQQRENPHLARFTDDIYSLGQIAYFVLSGVPPFGPLAGLADLGFSAGLAAWVEMARARRPDDRFENAEQALEGLQRLLIV